MAGKIIFGAVIGVLLLFIFVPGVRRIGTRLFTQSETIILPEEGQGDSGGRAVEFVTLLGFDAIPAILEPRLVTAPEAEQWMQPDEQVLGLSINGEHHAYPIKVLSRHEIANDVVGGLPVAVTW